MIEKAKARSVYSGSKLHREGTPRWRTAASRNNPCGMFGRPGDQYRDLLEETLASMTQHERHCYEENGSIELTDGRDVVTYRYRDGAWRRAIVHRNGALA